MGKKHQALKAEDGEELQLLTPYGGDLKKKRQLSVKSMII